MALTNDSFLTPEEQQQLEKNTNLRQRVIDSMVKGGVPDKVGEIRVLNELIANTDKSIYDRANARLKASADDTNSKALDIVTQILNQPYEVPDRPRTHDLGDIHVPTDIVHGETAIDREELDIIDFIKE